ncbi:Cytosolic enolase 3 [Dichanthelium oligosanthes]|uniref:phosphopyruvate hydratase n=1 Tax=Dichanthelium oligosanthes TaxID=888268 RepID=A0A1E5UU91_9POAL|nr:Cytosolic enolase 3 [Dichanthelium oligosanthes]
MSVQEYLEKHLLSRKIEEAVNAAVRAKAPDPVLFIAGHMRRAVPAVITRVRARQILDGHGAPAVEVELHTNKAVHRASAAGAGAPEGAAADAAGDSERRKILARVVADAVRVINGKVSVALVGMDPQQQAQIDQAIMDLDKARHKAELGANAMLAVSIAACKAGAAEKEVPLYKHIADLVGKSATTLPVPAITVINGGKHAGNGLPIQEIMILPVGAKNFEEAMQMGSETYHHLKRVATLEIMVGLLQIFPGNISEGLDLVIAAIERAGYNGRVKLAIDVAATDFCVAFCYNMQANQVGTVTEAIEVVKQAKDAHWGVMVSHRSGDTEDSFIADLAVGAAAGQIKAGAPCRGECLTKYNQLLRIEEELGSEGVYAGENWRTASTS